MLKTFCQVFEKVSLLKKKKYKNKIEISFLYYLFFGGKQNMHVLGYPLKKCQPISKRSILNLRGAALLFQQYGPSSIHSLIPVYL